EIITRSAIWSSSGVERRASRLNGSGADWAAAPLVSGSSVLCSEGGRGAVSITGGTFLSGSGRSGTGGHAAAFFASRQRSHHHGHSQSRSWGSNGPRNRLPQPGQDG